tara:strand:+ start:496 stop:633 length:138 start_codon:yes stop_codon:yes gene_type:complete
MPAVPHENKNSTTPIFIPVKNDEIVPKETAGARHAKYRKRIAGKD